MVINSWFGHSAGNNMIKKIETSFTINLIQLSSTVAYCHCRLLFSIHFNAYTNSLVLFIFYYKIIISLFFNNAPPAPHFVLSYTPGGAAAPSVPLLPAVMGLALVFRYRNWIKQSNVKQHCIFDCIKIPETPGGSLALKYVLILVLFLKLASGCENMNDHLF